MDPKSVNVQLRRHLECNGLLETSTVTCWKIHHSKLSGRGLIASRNIECNELVYADAAIVMGPRCYRKYLPMCVKCYKTGCALFPCDYGCGLPVCSDGCQNSPEHTDAECAYLRALEPNCGSDWSIELLQAVVPIRALLLRSDYLDILYALECHEAAQPAREVAMLKRNVNGSIKQEDEKLMQRVCRIMDTNSFETAVMQSDSLTSLRALFPVGALTNHQCIPNTRHLVNAKGELLVFATKFIAVGDEITMAYTDLIWDTAMRRQFLRATKHFTCQCPRCSDATERGSFLSALNCAKDKCSGHLLPDAPLLFSSAWTCNKCGLLIKSKQIASIKAGIIAAIEEVLHENPRKILRFLKKELSVLVPQTNYVMMEMMFRIVSLLGRVDGFTWQELTNEELDIKIQYCEELIRCLDTLNCGECTKKGLILYELYCTNAEKLKRITTKPENVCVLTRNKIDVSVNEEILLDAQRILKDDIAAPKDYHEMYNRRSFVNCTI